MTLQCPMACPGLATHTQAGLCALWLPSTASSSGKLQKSIKPPSPQTTCPALHQPPVPVTSQQQHTAEAAFDLAVPHGMPRPGHKHTDRAVWRAAPPQLKNSRKRQTAAPLNHLLSLATASTQQCRLHQACCILQRLHLTLQCPMACPRLATHTLAGLCAQ